MRTKNLKCEICNKPYTAKYNRYGYRATCSRECQTIKQRVTCRKKNNKPQRRCLACGSIFRVYRAHLRKGENRGIYCSKECRWNFKYDKDFKKKQQDAGNYINKKINKGEIKRPNKCSNCGKVKKTDAHHYIDYEKENRSRIKWLCRSCHITEHERLKREQYEEGAGSKF